MLESNSKAEKKPMIQACGLWENEDRKGNKYLSGTLGGIKVFIFINEYKEKPNHPDYKMFLGERPRRQGEDDAPETNTAPVSGPSGGTPGDDIPF